MGDYMMIVRQLNIIIASLFVSVAFLVYLLSGLKPSCREMTALFKIPQAAGPCRANCLFKNAPKTKDGSFLKKKQMSKRRLRLPHINSIV